MKKQIESLLLQNKTSEVKDIIFKEINANPNAEPELYALLGTTYAIEKNNQLALQYYNMAYELAPQNFDIVTTICNFLIANGDQQSATILMERLTTHISNEQATEKNNFPTGNYPTVENNNADNNNINNTIDDAIDNIESIDSTDDFDYMDFILGGGDALNYEYKPENEQAKSTGENSTVAQKSAMEKSTATAKSQPMQQGFSYAELITNDDINDVLGKYNLPKMEQKQDPTSQAEKKNDTVEQKKNIANNTQNNFNNPNNSSPNNSAKPTPQRTVKPKMLFTMFGWNDPGGGTVLPKAVITELAKRGYEVAVFYATAKHPIERTPYFMEKTIDNGVKLYGIYNRPTMFLDVDNPQREICDTQIIALFNAVLAEFQPNIINFHNFLGLSFEMATVAKSKNIITTFTTHNYHLLDPKLYIYNNDLVSWKSTDFFENSDLPNRYPMLKDAYKARIDKAKSLLLNDIDYTFAVSNRVKELLSDFCGSDEKICVINQIHNSLKSLIDKPIQNHRVGEKIRFVFIGDGIPHKGAHLIPQATQFLTNTNINFSLWGDFESEYGKAIKAIDKNNLITLRGRYGANDLRKIAEQSDVAIATSICEETGPIILSEYLAMNLPVVASKIGGVDDFIIDGYNGSLFTAGSPKALAAVIQSLVENPFKIAKMREHCRIPYSFDDYISHLENIFNCLSAGERPKASEFDLSFRRRIG